MTGVKVSFYVFWALHVANRNRLDPINWQKYARKQITRHATDCKARKEVPGMDGYLLHASQYQFSNGKIATLRQSLILQHL